MDRTAHLEKGIGNSPVSVEAALGNARRTSTVHDEAMEKMEKQLKLCFHEMMTGFLNLAVVTLKAKEIYGHVSQDRENPKSFSASVLL